MIEPDAQRPPREATAADPAPASTKDRPKNSPQPQVEGHRRLYRDGYRRGTGARLEWYRDRVNGWRDQPAAVTS